MPPDQWTKEVELWFASGLASLQQSLLEWITKPWPTGHPEARYPIVNMTALGVQYAARSLSSQKDSLCRNQLIRSSAAVQNFSVLALFVVVVLSLALIVTAAVLPACVDATRSRGKRRGTNLSDQAEAGRVARIADGKYGLLAMALQAAGVSGWVRGGAEIPVTEGRVIVSLPREMDGVVSYAAPGDFGVDRKVRPESASGDSVSKPRSEAATATASSEKGCEKKWDSDLDGGRHHRLEKRSTDLTLVGSPRSGDFLEKQNSGGQ